ncbi:MAG: coniferyl aldehyde dehydrogenase [Steroidobacteraceae bacterium]
MSTLPDKYSADLRGLLERQRSAFQQQGPPSLAQRRADLNKLRAAVFANRVAIAAAIEQDFGQRSRHETAILEIYPLTQGIRYLDRNLRRFMQPERRHVGLLLRAGRARVEYQPLGVVGIVAPWNYPLSLALMPLATAIAAGNRALLKLSEWTPATSHLIARMLGDLFPHEQVAVVTGDAAVGAAFCALPLDHLLFTGSTAVGRSVAKAAAEQLVPVTLELGGKSPVVIERGYSMDRAATAVAYGKLANAGQTCIAPDYVLLHESDVESFVAAYDRAVRSLYPEGQSSKDYASIINARHYERLRALIEDARTRGARVVEVGAGSGTSPDGLRRFAPLILLDVTDDMAVVHEEIFGPILPVQTYRDIDDAIAYINARPRPLALYYFGAESVARHKVLTRTVSGNVTVNGTLLHYAQDDLPFGGVGASGMGAYHGMEGFRRLSHAKGIFEQGRCNAATLLRPPFGKLAEVFIRLMLR